MAEQTPSPPDKPASSWPAILFFALFFAGVGLIMLTQATTGVGLICFGAALAVWARIAQARFYHRELVDLLRK